MGLTSIGYLLLAWWLVLNKIEQKAWIARLNIFGKKV
jgi:hypothetical protein